MEEDQSHKFLKDLIGKRRISRFAVDLEKAAPAFQEVVG